LPVNIQGRSRMREIRPYGSVRGAAGNGGPYRDKISEDVSMTCIFLSPIFLSRQNRPEIGQPGRAAMRPYWAATACISPRMYP
jgi:hypothetical protein